MQQPVFDIEKTSIFEYANLFHSFNLNIQKFIQNIILYESHLRDENIKITQDEKDNVNKIINLILSMKGKCFDREEGGHITSSAFVLNYEKTHVLLTLHKKLGKWLQLGGHNDGSSNCKDSAIREAKEESGIEGEFKVIGDIFDIDIHPIPGKCGYHYDVRYLLVAPKDAKINISEESTDLRWINLDELEKYTTDKNILRMRDKAKIIVSSL